MASSMRPSHRAVAGPDRLASRYYAPLRILSVVTRPLFSRLHPNPIEYMFSQLKSHLRAFKAKGAKALRVAVDRGLALIDTQHILAFYLTAWGHALCWEA